MPRPGTRATRSPCSPPRPASLSATPTCRSRRPSPQGTPLGVDLQPLRRRRGRAEGAQGRRRLWPALAAVRARGAVVLLLRRRREDRRQPAAGRLSGPCTALTALAAAAGRHPIAQSARATAAPSPSSAPRYLADAGFAVTLVAPDDRAWSVVGLDRARRRAASLLYHAHIDTVPLGQNARWTHDPFGGEVADGRALRAGQRRRQGAAGGDAPGAAHGWRAARTALRPADDRLRRRRRSRRAAGHALAGRERLPAAQRLRRRRRADAQPRGDRAQGRAARRLSRGGRDGPCHRALARAQRHQRHGAPDPRRSNATRPRCWTAAPIRWSAAPASTSA